jgi:hypothetical protein
MKNYSDDNLYNNSETINNVTSTTQATKTITTAIAITPLVETVKT